MKKVHLSLPVADIAASRAFYNEFFGAEPSKEKVDYLKYEPADLALNISFHPLADGAVAEPQRHHLGVEFDSAEALDAAHQRLLRADLVADERQAAVCCYADQDKFHVQDPSGYRWELYRLLQDTDRRQQPDSGCCVGDNTQAACC